MPRQMNMGELAKLRAGLGWDPLIFIDATVKAGYRTPDQEPILNRNLLWRAESGSSLTYVNAEIIAGTLNYGYRQNKGVELNLTPEKVLEMFERDKVALEPSYKRPERRPRDRKTQSRPSGEPAEDSIREFGIPA